MVRSKQARRALALVALAALGCNGEIGNETPLPNVHTPDAGGSAGGGRGGAGAGGSGGAGGAPSPADDLPGAAPLRRLTKLEYNNTVRDLLGLPGPADDSFIDDQIVNHSGFAGGAPIDQGSDAAQFMTGSEQVVARALPQLLAGLPCAPVPAAVAAQDTCMQTFLTGFGLRAYRRPLGADELGDLMALFRQQRSPASGALGFPDALRIVVTAIIQSPYFLYRWELGEPAIVEHGLVRFNAYELASRLSYFFWATMPDATLFAAAASGELARPERLAAEARRMLADGKARDALRDFHLQWLDASALPALDKDASFTAYSPALAQSMLDETAAVASHLFGKDGDGKLETLLTSTTSYVDGPLARFYGIAGITGAGQQVTLPPGRAGVLTQASFVASHATAQEGHPFRRGKAVLASVLCVELEPPPNPSEPIMLPPRDPADTTREHFTKASNRPCAASCHNVLNPVGFAFEHFDAVGAYRATDSGKAVDASGSVALASGDQRFDDAVGLGRILGRAPEARDCVARQWLRYLLRREEVRGETRSLASAGDAFGAAGYDLRELVIALTATRAFTHRLPTADELRGAQP